MKKFDYESPKIDIILLNADDVLSESEGFPESTTDGNETPWL